MEFSTNFAPEKFQLFYEFIQITGRIYRKNHDCLPFGSDGSSWRMHILTTCFQGQAWPGSMPL
jgi:hypothetical protein